MLPAISSGSRVLRSEMLTQALTNLEPMHHQRACRKEPARGSPLGRYAGRPRLTPGLKFEIRPIVRTFARCPAARRLRTKATLPGLAVSTDATWQQKSINLPRSLG